jgi:hypothetical protein
MCRVYSGGSSIDQENSCKFDSLPNKRRAALLLGLIGPPAIIRRAADDFTVRPRGKLGYARYERPESPCRPTTSRPISVDIAEAGFVCASQILMTLLR